MQLYPEGQELSSRSSNCLGFIGDSEAANKKALADLEEEYPFLINVLCQAHGLNNLVKVSYFLNAHDERHDLQNQQIRLYLHFDICFVYFIICVVGPGQGRSSPPACSGRCSQSGQNRDAAWRRTAGLQVVSLVFLCRSFSSQWLVNLHQMLKL